MSCVAESLSEFPGAVMDFHCTQTFEGDYTVVVVKMRHLGGDPALTEPLHVIISVIVDPEVVHIGSRLKVFGVSPLTNGVMV